MGATEDRDPLLLFARARADSADRQARLEADPQEIRARERDRRLARLLIAMVLSIIASGFVISIVGLLLTGGR